MTAGDQREAFLFVNGTPFEREAQERIGQMGEQFTESLTATAAKYAAGEEVAVHLKHVTRAYDTLTTVQPDNTLQIALSSLATGVVSSAAVGLFIALFTTTGQDHALLGALALSFFGAMACLVWMVWTIKQ